jgi:hypothetical protein
MIGLEIEIPQRYRTAFDKKNVQAVLRAAGAEIASVARRKIRQAVGGGRVYYGKGRGRHQASLPGQPPASWSGNLAGSIRARPFKNGDGVLIRDTAFYDLFLEAGAKGVGSRRRKARSGNRNRRLLGGVNSPVPQGGRGVLAPRPALSAALAERSASIGPRVQQAVMKDMKFQRVSASGKP